MFLLSGCIESLVTIGGGVSSGKFTQTSLQSAASYGVKKTTGKTPFGHVANYIKKDNSKINKSCSSFNNKKDLELCLILEKRITSKQAKLKEKKNLNKPSKLITSSLQSFINEKSKIKYLDK